MKGIVILIYILLTAASPTGQSLSQSRHALDSKSWHLTRLSLRSGSLLPSLLAIFCSVFALSIIAVGAKSSFWPKLHTKARTTCTKASYLFTPAYVTPLYVHRITQARIRLAQHRVTQVCVNACIGLAQNNRSDIDTQVELELWTKKREKIREKRKNRLSKGPRIDPEKLKKINHEWRQLYGFKSRDLFHIENELDNIVCKVPRADSKKSKTIKFDDSVKVIYITKANTGRRMSRWDEPSHVSNYSLPEFTSRGDAIV